ncbi:hypothetical protein IFM89_032393 [Coptis chinensis]|uniref:Uncharacterized protein n=1 Tax=Coptis chinensis TaxID=261450 RepID=A0A835HWT1_9MAGN|nr:hypothetical protein IFM89_032393 [Coptis chinensis]
MKEEEITSRLVNMKSSQVAMNMKVLKDVQELKQDVEELNITKDVDDGRVAKAKGESKLVGDIEELKIKLRKVETKLNKVCQSSAVTSHFQVNLLMGGLNWLERMKDSYEAKRRQVHSCYRKAEVNTKTSNIGNTD